jgi:hypothetical protein
MKARLPLLIRLHQAFGRRKPKAKRKLSVQISSSYSIDEADRVRSSSINRLSR